MAREPDLSDDRIIIVDDGIEWTQEARDLMQDCVILPGEKPFIFARNINIGIRSTFRRLALQIHGQQETFIEGGPNRHVVLLNDDALLDTPYGFSLLAKEAEEHREFGLIGATTNLTGQPLQKPRGIGLREVPHIAFVAVLIPTWTLELVGLMDERYCLDYGCDDADYCETVALKELKVGVHDGCYVDHGSLRSSFRGDPKAPGNFRQNLGLLMQKWGGRLVSQPGLRAG
jgi:GT2 family glycosyltransferase